MASPAKRRDKHMLSVKHSPGLERHLSTFEVDGITVASMLFPDGRIFYPGRRQVEQLLQGPDPYTLAHEARVVEGLYGSVVRSIWVLSAAATEMPDLDPTLEVLWASHASSRPATGGAPSLDRLVAALVAVQAAREGSQRNPAVEEAAVVLVRALDSLGFPPRPPSLEELWDGAAPACVGLGLVEA